MTRTNKTLKSIAGLTAALTAWTIFALYTVQTSTGSMLEAVKTLA